MAIDYDELMAFRIPETEQTYSRALHRAGLPG